jgi:hypothetical protein
MVGHITTNTTIFKAVNTGRVILSVSYKIVYLNKEIKLLDGSAPMSKQQSNTDINRGILFLSE